MKKSRKQPPGPADRRYRGLTTQEQSDFYFRIHVEQGACFVRVPQLGRK